MSISLTSNRRNLPVPTTASGRGQRTLLVFSLAGQTYALPLLRMQEIVPMAALSRPPGLPDMLAGFLNLGGTAVPVVRLDRLFKLPDLTPGLYTPLLILRSAEGPLALMAERVSKIVSVPEDQIVPVRDSYSFNECADGIWNGGPEGMIILLSPERLLLEKERQSLAELEAREQERLRQWEVTGW